MIGISPVYLVGLVFAIGGATALAIQNIALRVGTDEGQATDAVAVVAAVNVVVLVPISVVRYYPDFGLTPGPVAAVLAAGLAGTMLGRALVYGSIERIGACRTTPIVASYALVAVLVLGGDRYVTPTAQALSHRRRLIHLVGDLAGQQRRSPQDAPDRASPADHRGTDIRHRTRARENWTYGGEPDLWSVSRSVRGSVSSASSGISGGAASCRP